VVIKKFSKSKLKNALIMRLYAIIFYEFIGQEKPCFVMLAKVLLTKLLKTKPFTLQMLYDIINNTNKML